MRRTWANSRARRHLLVVRTYHVNYQLKRAELRMGSIHNHFFAQASRRFCTDELPVILAELYEEVGPAPDLLGLEILAIHPLLATY